MQHAPYTLPDDTAAVQRRTQQHCTVRYAAHHWDQTPIPAHTARAFARADAWWADLGKPAIIMDSGCGMGHSALHLARAHPNSAVIGVDRSGMRLARAQTLQARLGVHNLLFIQAQLTAFWRLALWARWPVQEHCLFYPNPYPKPKQLKKRFYAQPGFGQLLRLAGITRLHTNLLTYAWHWARALFVAPCCKT